MAKLPTPKTTTVNKIYKWYEDNDEGNRPHLGASLIGRECERELWYGFRWAIVREFEGRILRLFTRGDQEEIKLVSELRSIGVEVWEEDEQGKQFRCSFLDGHFSGSCDGIAKGLAEAPATPHLLEFKTWNKKTFAELTKKGVKEAKFEHYAQMQTYMKGLGLKRAMYLATCKDDDHIYSERVYYDAKVAKSLIEKAKRIIYADHAPLKLSDNPTFYKCKFCDFIDVCHYKKVPDVNCRTCIHSSPAKDAKWKCVKGQECKPNQQHIDCLYHLFVPALLPSDILEANAKENWIQYDFGINGPKTNSKCLTSEQIKEKFNG